MALLQIQNVTVGFGGDPILRSVSMTVDRSEKIGIVGSNGAGKSTLIKAILGEITPERGSIVLEGTAHSGAGGSARLESDTHKAIAYVPQLFPPEWSGSTTEFVLEMVLQLRAKLRDVEDRMASPEALVDTAYMQRLLDRYGHLRNEYDRIDGDNAEAQVAPILDRVGLTDRLDTEIGVLSGGEKNRLLVARALLQRPELIIMDEPGNHLDAWGLEWLERMIRDFSGAVIIVSHNRYLLDRTVTRIVELRRGEITSWSGNYSAYRGARLREAVATARAAKADAKRVDRLEAMVRYLAELAKNKPDPGVGRRLRASRTKLRFAREDARERPDIIDEKMRTSLSTGESKADVALELRGYSRAIGTNRLFTSASALVHTGERVALVGPNGCGKTTLLRDIVNEGRWDAPHVRVGPSMKIGYCPQGQEIFDPERTIEENLATLVPAGRDRIFSLVQRYLFSYEDLDRPVGTLSGGERNRLQLARAELIGANFLILDEPTNHLDIAGREAVEEALNAFRGTVLVVSHDRFFLDIVADRILYYDDGTLGDFEGSFTAYWREVEARQYGGLPRAVNRIGNTHGTARDRRSQGTSVRSAPSRRGDGDTPSIEQRLMDLEAKRVALEGQLAAAYEGDQLESAQRIAKQLEKTNRLYENLYAAWGT
jgi:ATP-binding cassette subfamily F protein 3